MGVSFKDLRQQSGMSRKEFSEYFNIPYRTVQNWELELRECPDYLLELIRYKLDNEKGQKEAVKEDTKKLTLFEKIEREKREIEAMPDGIEKDIVKLMHRQNMEQLKHMTNIFDRNRKEREKRKKESGH